MAAHNNNLGDYKNFESSVKIKICGIRSQSDANACNLYMPDFCGFVFAPSKRRITPMEAMRLRQRLDSHIESIGVFTQMSVDDIAVLYEYGIIGAAQLHGGQSDEFITSLKMKCGVPIIQAVRFGTSDSPSRYADFWLYDGQNPGSGTGFDWQRIPNTAKPWFLAGGINLENIETAMDMKPFCVDISSGAETDYIKDPEKIRKLVEKVRTKGNNDG
jgi:phosphoribosylanthranilate isomerase